MSCSSDPAPTLRLSITGTWSWEGAGSCHSVGYWGSEGPRMKWEWIQPDPSCVKMNLPHPWRALPCPALPCSSQFPVLPIFPGRVCHLVLHLAGACLLLLSPSCGCLSVVVCGQRPKLQAICTSPSSVSSSSSCTWAPGLRLLPGVWSPWKPVISGLSRQQLNCPDT